MMVVIPFGGSATLPLEVEESDVEGRFVFVGKWQHFFEGQPTWSDTRWVFDREDWSVAFLEILNPATMEWVCATRDEVSSVERDMNESDSRFLDDLDEWGCLIPTSCRTGRARAQNSMSDPSWRHLGDGLRAGGAVLLGFGSLAAPMLGR